MSELERVEDNFKSLILNTCNSVGCKDCGLKYLDGDRCESDILQDRIYELKEQQRITEDV